MYELPKIVQKKPDITYEKAGKKAFCTLGLSSKDPNYDVSHKGTGLPAEIVILKENKKVA